MTSPQQVRYSTLKLDDRHYVVALDRDAGDMAASVKVCEAVDAPEAQLIAYGLNLIGNDLRS